MCIQYVKPEIASSGGQIPALPPDFFVDIVWIWQFCLPDYGPIRSTSQDILEIFRVFQQDNTLIAAWNGQEFHDLVTWEFLFQAGANLCIDTCFDRLPLQKIQAGWVCPENFLVWGKPEMVDFAPSGFLFSIGSLIVYGKGVGVSVEVGPFVLDVNYRALLS